MTAYDVMLELTGSARVIVEAENEEEAESKARDLAEDGWSDVDLQYEIEELIHIIKAEEHP